MASLLILAGCAPELGECDALAATNVAYDRATGLPAYEGQALVVASCASGFCHSDAIPECNRAGVPAGLTFDVQLASADGTVDEDAIARQRNGRFRVAQEARAMLHTVDIGVMPPPPTATPLCATTDVTVAAIHRSRPVYLGRRSGGSLEPLPAIDTPEGREILRNWLACGAPVVERPVARDDGVMSVVVPGLPLPPIEPTWASIFRDLLGARGCGSDACHGGTSSGFRVSDSASTHAALVGATASGDECGGSATLVVAGDPDASLLLNKLGPSTDVSCGDPMPSGGIPLGATDLEAVRTWIANGALAD